MVAKVKQTSYNVMINLKFTIGITISADSLQDAVTKAEAMKINDIVDFAANDWDHNDSEPVEITGIFR